MRPFAVDIAARYGLAVGDKFNRLAGKQAINPQQAVEAAERQRRLIKYIYADYADARRFAKPKGLTILAPARILDPSLARMAWPYAQRRLWMPV
ncbi:MAG TPA: hypothetical protein VFB15_02940 [Candidatus Binataceae bacterium]|nr:hypothetical protein [Candidatus Binataceae bacterium]